MQSWTYTQYVAAQLRVFNSYKWSIFVNILFPQELRYFHFRPGNFKFNSQIQLKKVELLKKWLNSEYSGKYKSVWKLLKIIQMDRKLVQYPELKMSRKLT